MPAACSSKVTNVSGGASTASAGGNGGSTAVVTAPVANSSASSAGGATAATTGSAGGGGASSACGPFEGAVLAVDKLFLGDKTFTGMAAPDAWKGFGFDIDGSPDTDLTQHCQPNSGGSTSEFENGTNSRDNSFGRNIRPLIEQIAPNLDDNANGAIASGAFTEIFAFDKLGMMADMTPLATKLYGGGVLGMSPKWDGPDCWPVLYESLTNGGDVSTAKVVFPNATLTSNAWSSNGNTTTTLQLNMLGQSVAIRVYLARGTVTLDNTHEGGAMGQLGGVVETEELVQAMKQAAGAINPSLCALFDSYATQIRQASDILVDGTQDPQKTCDAISVGIGFTLRQVAFGKIAAPAPPPKMPCQ